MGGVVVVGSYNVGLTVISPTLPAVGQTVLGHTFDMGPGGKGSNQAIGAKRLGADVTLVAKVGNDSFGQDAIALFEREGLAGPGIFRSDTHTGVGLILVDDEGRNEISVAPGANAELSGEDLDAVLGVFESGSSLLCQLECSLELFVAAAARARAAGMAIILNPAPARTLDDRVLGSIDVLTPNETELEVVSGTSGDIERAARSLIERGVGEVVVTLGEQGALWVTKDGERSFPASRVPVVDTTGAGDAFNAGLVTGLSLGASMEEAVALACRAGGFCTTRIGVLEGLPTCDQLDREVPR